MSSLNGNYDKAELNEDLLEYTPILEIEEGDKENGEKGLTVFEASLALISFVVGGGIVSIPFAFTQCGLYLAIFLNLACSVMGYWSGLLYIKAK